MRLLVSKLRPPVTTPHVVPRPRFDDWFGAAARAKVVLIQAPAGFGKTTVMARWLSRAREEGKTVAWLDLDEADNDPARFLCYLQAALHGAETCERAEQAEQAERAERADSAAPAAPAAAVTEGGESAAASLLNLLEWVSLRESPFVLFLDNLEAVSHPEVFRSLRQLLEHLPPQHLLVLATRSNPDLGVGRLRALEQMVEIGADDLRFNLDETEQFLCQRRGLTLSGGELRTLHQRTEGWAVGLQLACLALEKDESTAALVQSFSGSFAEIADYLAEDVLSRQADDVRTFLLETSILQRLSGPLCDAVTGREDGYAMLERLERANLFVVPLDRERRWYRYHYLFAQFLRSRLERGQRHRLHKLHRAAATYLSERGQHSDAVRHCLEGGDPERAAEQMARCAPELLAMGQVDTLIEWGRRLPAAALSRQPHLRLQCCWSLVGTYRYAEAAQMLERIEGERRPEGEEDPATVSAVLAIRPTILLGEGRFEECLQAAEPSLDQISPEHPFEFGVLSNILAFCKAGKNDFDQALALLARSRNCHSRLGNVYPLVYAMCFEGMVELARGHLGRALELHREAFEQAKAATPGYSLPAAIASAFLGLCRYERGELEVAEPLLVDHLEILADGAMSEVTAMAYQTLARIRFAQGDYPAALQLLDAFEGAEKSKRAGRCSPGADLERLRLALRAGDLERAGAVAERLERSGLWQTEEPFVLPAEDTEPIRLGQLRLWLRQGRARQALPELRALGRAAERAGRRRRALKTRIVEAEALLASGEPGEALRAMRRALRSAAGEGFVRAFADEGPSVAGLVADACREGGEEDLPAGYLQRILAASGAHPAAPAEAAGEEPALLEPLTDRELEVLRQVAQGLSNQDLAERLFVSANTVKYHLRNINSKLSASNRTEAVSKARRLSLIY